MAFIIYFFIFLFGLIVGSFLNCVIYRLEKKESFVSGRSYCPHCQHQLSFYDLIPVLSFFLLKRKCRYCRQPISWQYPTVEISTALIFLLIFNFFTPTPKFGVGASFPIFSQLSIIQLLNFIYYLLISCSLIIIFVYDLKHFIIPDKMVYPTIIVSGIWYFVSGLFFNIYTKYEILNTIYGAIGVAAFFLAIVLFSRGKWMGLGDVKLAFLMGLILGFPDILVALFLAFFIGAIIGLGLTISQRKTLKSEIPFGPFLVAGTFIALFWGQNIINWYVHLFS